MPCKKKLSYVCKRMNEYHLEFNIIYGIKLPDQQINPLKKEQKAWQLLSPLIEHHLAEFGNYIRHYSRTNKSEDDKTKLQHHLNRWWNLLQKWNTISRSYKAKHEEMWDDLEEREKKVEELIEELSEK